MDQHIDKSLSSPLSFSKIFYFYFMCMGVLPVYCVHGGPKKALDPLELELQWAVGDCVGAGDGASVLWKSSQHSELSSRLSRPHNGFVELPEYLCGN